MLGTEEEGLGKVIRRRSRAVIKGDPAGAVRPWLSDRG